MKEINKSIEAIQSMIDKMLDDTNFGDLESSQQMVARGEVVQKLIATEVESRRVEVERTRVIIQAMETAGKYNIDTNKLGLPQVEMNETL